MCGRFSSIQSIEKLAQAYNAKAVGTAEYEESYNVAPTEQVPIIIEDDNSEVRIIELAAFGMRMRINGKTFPLINIQSEKAHNRKDFKTHRCIIPANGFYEWEKISAKDKQPYYFSLKARSFSFAGVWKKDATGLSFSILTTVANDTVGTIHNRMPVILSHNAAGLWLEPNTDVQTLPELMEPLPDGLMQSWKVSKEVNKPDKKHAALINSI